MEPKGWILFNILINRYHPRDTKQFVGQLPPEVVQELQKHHINSQDASAVVRDPSERLSHIHASWLAPAIEKLPQPLRPLLLAALPSAQQRGLARVLSLPLPKMTPSKPIKRFLLHQLSLQIFPDHLMPASYLSENQLAPLLALTKIQLVHLIDFMGLRDLAEAVRPIVDKRILQAVQGALTTTELQLLNSHLQHRERLKVSKLDLSGWNGQRDSLRLMFHQRGLLRLAKALSGQSKDFIWHVLHTLDSRRAAFIEKALADTAIPGVTPLLIQQILSLMAFLKKREKIDE